MQVSYQNTLDGISPKNINGFFVGWPNPPNPDTHIKILEGSDEFILALNQETGHVVGFITAITDKVITAFIPHLEVKPEFQGKGIGSELVRRMITKLKNYYAIDLTCDPDVQPFYESLGMRKHSAMLVRNYSNQSGENNSH